MRTVDTFLDSSARPHTSWNCNEVWFVFFKYRSVDINEMFTLYFCYWIDRVSVAELHADCSRCQRFYCIRCLRDWICTRLLLERQTDVLFFGRFVLQHWGTNVAYVFICFSLQKFIPPNFSFCLPRSHDEDKRHISRGNVFVRSHRWLCCTQGPFGFNAGYCWWHITKAKTANPFFLYFLFFLLLLLLTSFFIHSGFAALGDRLVSIVVRPAVSYIDCSISDSRSLVSVTYL